MRKFLEAVAENEDDYSFENYGYGATIESVPEGPDGQHHLCQECGNVPGQPVGGALYERYALNSQNDNLIFCFR